MTTFFMRGISLIFHPLLISSYSCILLYWIMPEIYSPIPVSAVPYFITVIFVLTFLIPALSILILMLTKGITSLEMTRREDRVIPFFFITAFYAFSTYLFNTKMILPHAILVLMIVVSFLVGVILLISTKFKISVHSAGIWGTTGLFTALFIRYLDTSTIFPLLILYIIAGLTTTSRLYLGRHTPEESWAGVFVGFTVCFTGFLLFA